jgi:hypothetical protein
MPALTTKNNAYAPQVAFPPRAPIATRVAQRCSRTDFGSPYSRQERSQSITDAQHLSSFGSASEVIESLFDVEGAVGVYQYVGRHPELFNLLLRARAEAYWLFGPQSKVLVRLERDPEEEFEPRLLALIQTDLVAVRALKLLDMLDDSWWLSVSPASRALMKIDVEYV